MSPSPSLFPCPQCSAPSRAIATERDRRYRCCPAGHRFTTIEILSVTRATGQWTGRSKYGFERIQLCCSANLRRPSTCDLDTFINRVRGALKSWTSRHSGIYTTRKLVTGIRITRVA